MEKNPALIPTPFEESDGDNRWFSLHEQFKKETKYKEPNVVLIGDTIIQLMQLSEEWKKHFEPLHCLNFGIANDRAENILWRIENGELDFEIDPKVVVLLAGTNNTPVEQNTAECISEALLAIVDQIRRRLITTHILVVEIPPRGRHPNRLREKITRLNTLLREHVIARNDPKITFLSSCSRELVSTHDGTISHTDMFDFLNFTNEGYRKFCEPIIDEINAILAPK